MRTKDVDELIEPVSNYCNHTGQVAGPTRNIDRRLEVASAAAQPLIHLSYGEPVQESTPATSPSYS
jgi:hypothetical protein